MKTLSFFCTIGLFCLPFFSLAQSETENDDKVYKSDISFNVTKLLGNVLSINDDNSGVPYAFSYRRHNTRHGIRISMATSFENSTRTEFEFFSKLKKRDVQLRVGYERIHALSKKIIVMYGLDVLGNYEVEKSEIDGFQGSFNQKDLLWEAGIGPAIRLSFNINRRLSIHTESSLYYTMGQLRQDNNSINIPNSTTDLWALQLSLPQALFITLAF